MTFGYELAVRVDEIDRRLDRIEEAEPRIFVGNITGAVGTMASFGPHGLEMQRRALARLGLGSPRICWRPARDRVAGIAWLLVQVSATLGKIANEIHNVQRPGIDGVNEPFHLGKMGSSTMPHKRNPAGAGTSVALRRLVRGLLAPPTGALFQEHERGASTLRVELAAVLVYCGPSSPGCAPSSRTWRRFPSGCGTMRTSSTASCSPNGSCSPLERGSADGPHTRSSMRRSRWPRGEREPGSARSSARSPRAAPYLGPEALHALLDPARYLGLAGRIVDEGTGE